MCSRKLHRIRTRRINSDFVEFSLALSPRQAELLKFLVDQTLDGHGHELKESVIAAEVCGTRTTIQNARRTSGAKSAGFA